MSKYHNVGNHMSWLIYTLHAFDFLLLSDTEHFVLTKEKVQNVWRLQSADRV